MLLWKKSVYYDIKISWTYQDGGTLKEEKSKTTNLDENILIFMEF